MSCCAVPFFSPRLRPRCGTVILLLLLRSSLLLRTIAAQEKPFADVDIFDINTPNYRSSLCGRQWQLSTEEVSLEDALRGLELSVAITNYAGVSNEENFFALSEDGRIKEADPGLFVVILDEIALRAGFSWRNSFVEVVPLNATVHVNKTWTDVLKWETDHFDIAADYFGKSTARMALGISFPKGWYDGSVILAWSSAKQTAESPYDKYWSFLRPFDGLVWLAILIAIFLTGMAYFLLERLHVGSDVRPLGKTPFTAVFLASISFTGHFAFRPRTRAARLLSLSWTMWVLIIGSAYTANLASFLVFRDKVEFSVNTLEDALRQGIPVCIQRSSVMDDILATRYPNLIVVRKETNEEMFVALHDDWYDGSEGCGVALTNMGTFEVYQRNQSVNGDCTLTTEKRVVQKQPAGFATAVDTDIFCTSLVSDVMNVHLNKMMVDGFIRRAWENHLEKATTITCSAEGSVTRSALADDDGNFSLSIEEMAGIFMLHLALAAVALLFAYGEQESRKRKRMQPSQMDLSHSC